MDNRQSYITVITRRLNYLRAEVESFNTLNLTDINVYAENFYRDFLKLLGFNFTNTNYYEQNYAHIDLIDEDHKLAIQVTSQNDNEKIRSAIEGFHAKPEYQGYNLKVLLIAKKAKDYRTKFGHDFNHKEDVLDVDKLLKQIEDKTTPELKEIADFLDNEILPQRKPSESNEVETIMTLIDYLSQNKNREIKDNETIVDPQKKIEVRFSEHSYFIKHQYSSLYGKYNFALITASEKIDTVDAEIISDYLQDESDLLLTKNDNNPKLALAELVNMFYEKLTTNGLKFDKQAIKFYLLNELIKCNVFPNS